MESIAHLTLFTGHMNNSPRKDVSRQTIDALMPYVMSGGGEIKDTGWTVRMVQGVSAGSCGFTLHHSSLWLFSCYMAWTKVADTKMWDIVRQVSNTSIPKPRSGAWLAIHAMPSMPLILFKAPHALKEAGDLERCIAWTVIEGMTGSTPLAA